MQHPSANKIISQQPVVTFYWHFPENSRARARGQYPKAQCCGQGLSKETILSRKTDLSNSSGKQIVIDMKEIWVICFVGCKYFLQHETNQLIRAGLWNTYKRVAILSPRGYLISLWKPSETSSYLICLHLSKSDFTEANAVRKMSYWDRNNLLRCLPYLFVLCFACVWLRLII